MNIYIYIVVCITVVVFSIPRVVSPLHVLASTVVVLVESFGEEGLPRPRLAAVFVAVVAWEQKRAQTIALKDF